MNVARHGTVREWPFNHNEPDSEELKEMRRQSAALERIAKILDEFAGAFLNARFSGTGTDRWKRR